MGGISGILSAARSALIAQQAAIEVAGHNIANAETEGYSAQSMVLIPSTPQRTPSGIFGTGVVVTNVTRLRNSILDGTVREQAAPSAGFERQSALLESVESVLGEPTNTGLAYTMDAFWNSWSGLAADPTNAAAKAVVQQQSEALARTFNRYASQLDSIAASTRQEALDAVSEVNRLTTQIAEVNGQIVPMESDGKSANDLRDQRDLLIDRLAAIVPIRVIDTADGANQVTLGGIPLVDGGTHKSLAVDTGSTLAIKVVGSSNTLRNLGGRLGAIVSVSTDDLATVTRQLDALAAAFVTDVNALHSTGWSPPSGATGNWNGATPPTGGSGVNLFDATPVNATAKNIRLSAAVAADSNAIAAGSTLNGPGDNRVAVAIAALRDHSPTAPSNSFGGAYQSLVSVVAGSKRAAEDSATVSKALFSQATARRTSVSGVSTDEELVKLMKHQQAYVAASKVIQTIDEMSRALLDLKR